MAANNATSSKISWKVTALILVTVVLGGVNALRLGGDAFILNLNNAIPMVLSLAVAITSIVLWQRVARHSGNSLLWLGFTIGWILWTIAESWWGIATWINKELPYPSLADLFWLAGYIPLFFALEARRRSVPQATTSIQKWQIGLISLLAVGLTVIFVIVPIIQSFDAENMIGNILSMIYPLADLILLIMGLGVFFNYKQGTTGRTWLWISAGFILLVFSDMVFSYADFYGFYYPDGQANLISALVIDTSYNISILLTFFGLLSMQTAQRSHRVFSDLEPSITLVPNVHILLFIDGDDRVDDVSPNFSRVFQNLSYKGKLISDVLGCPPNVANEIFKNIKNNRILAEQKILSNTLFGQTPVQISGEPIFDPQGEYHGAIILLRMFLDDFSIDDSISDYEEGIVRSLLKKVGINEEEQVKQLLTNFYLPIFKSIYNLILGEGGSVMADAYLAELKSAATQNSWQIDFHANSLIDVSEMSLPAIRKAFPTLLKAAKGIAIKITDEDTVSKVIHEVKTHDNASIENSVEYYEKANT